MLLSEPFYQVTTYIYHLCRIPVDKSDHLKNCIEATVIIDDIGVSFSSYWVNVIRSAARQKGTDIILNFCDHIKLDDYFTHTALCLSVSYFFYIFNTLEHVVAINILYN